jgi:hypothetical protein
MARSRDSWSEDSLHAPTWLQLLNDHSIEPYETEWRCSFMWLDLVAPILDRIALVGQVGLKWNVVFNHHICRRLQTSLELGYMEDIVHT